MVFPADVVSQVSQIIPIPSLIKPGELVPSSIQTTSGKTNLDAPVRPTSRVEKTIIDGSEGVSDGSLMVTIGSRNGDPASSVVKETEGAITMNMIKDTLISKGDGFAEVFMQKAEENSKNLTNATSKIIIDPDPDAFPDSPFRSLTFRFQVTEDPRLKAISIYTCFSPKLVTALKHGPEIVYCQILPVRNTYSGLGANTPDVTDYSQDENFIEVKENSRSEIGMIRGGPEGIKFGSYYSYENYIIESTMFKNSPGSYSGSIPNRAFAIDSKNPICDKQFEIFDTKPIPSDIYSVWGYYNDITLLEPHERERVLATPGDRPENYAMLLTYQEYNRPNARCGVIVETNLQTGNNMYRVLSPNGEITWAMGQFSPYSKGTFVLMGLGSNGMWYIVPSSAYYWGKVIETELG